MKLIIYRKAFEHVEFDCVLEALGIIGDMLQEIAKVEIEYISFECFDKDGGTICRG